MSRKPTDTAHINLRIRESLRKKLDAEAENRRWSLNNEIRWRLEASFERQELLSLAANASHLETLVLRFSERFGELEKQGDLLRAAEALVTAIERDAPPEVIKGAIKDGVIRVKQTVNMIETAAKALPRNMHTTGEKI